MTLRPDSRSVSGMRPEAPRPRAGHGDAPHGLTAAERSFLIDQGGVPPEALTPEAMRIAVKERDEARDAAAAITWDELPVNDLWQIPGFAKVVDMFPPEYLPVDIDAALTSPSESFDGTTPAQWLRDGRPIAPVERWAHELHFD